MAASSSSSSSVDIRALWESHKLNPSDPSRFVAENPLLLYVPTGAGATDSKSLHDFLTRLDHSSSSSSSSNEDHSDLFSVLTTVVANDSGKLVEEAILTTAIGATNSRWICPGVELKNVIGKRVRIPTVTTVSFAGDKIATKRVYWDQANLLAQIGVLSPAVIKNNDLPILVNDDQARLVEAPKAADCDKLGKHDMSAELNELAVKNVEAAESRDANILNQGAQPPQFRSSSRVLQPGGTGGRSSIFSDEPEPRKMIPANPRRYQSQFQIGGAPDEAQARNARPTSASAANNMSSHFRIGNAGGDEAQPHATGKKAHPERTNVSQIDVAESNSDVSITGARKKPVAQNPNLVSQIGFGASPAEPAYVRPSSRVIRPPGGGSSLTLG